MYRLYVLVEMPDGTFSYRPIAREKEGRGEVVKKSSRFEGYEWAEDVLPDLISYQKVI